MRKHYLDNIRWAAIALVLVYHVFYLYNHAGIPGAVGGPAGAEGFDAFLYFVYPWFMVLLFLIAGIGARYSLQKRSCKQFIGERARKLLIPGTLGLFVYHWITGYLNITIGGGMDYIPKPLRYVICVVSGIGPMWFVQVLFLFSLLLVLVRLLDKEERIWNFCGKAPIAVLPLLAFPIWGFSQIGNLPVLTVYRFGIYGAAFFMGYFIFSHEQIQDAVEKIRIPMLVAAVILGIAYVAYYFGTDYTSPHCLQSFFTNLYLWAAVLAILGCGKAWFHRTSPFAAYMTRAGYGLYILHYPIVLFLCSLLYRYSRLPAAFLYIIALAGEAFLTAALYEGVRRAPVIRYFVLGVKKKKLRK